MVGSSRRVKEGVFWITSRQASFVWFVVFPNHKKKPQHTITINKVRKTEKKKVWETDRYLPLLAVEEAAEIGSVKLIGLVRGRGGRGDGSGSSRGRGHQVEMLEDLEEKKNEKRKKNVNQK